MNTLTGSLVSDILKLVTPLSHDNYRIAENFGKVFNLAIWRFSRKSPLYKPANKIFDVYDVMTSSAVAKFKIRQYVLGSDSPNVNARQSFPLYGIYPKEALVYIN